MRCFFLIAIFFLSSCAPEENADFTLNGKLKELDGSIFRILRNGKVYDTDTVKNGTFSLHARLPNLELVMVHYQAKNPKGGKILGKPSDGFIGAEYFFVEKGASYILTANSYEDFFNHKQKIITTSKNQEQFDLLNRLKYEQLDFMKKKREELEVVRAYYLEKGDMTLYNRYSDSVRHIQTNFSPVREAVNKFMYEHPNTYATIYTLSASGTLKKDFDLYKSIYARLTPQFKNHRYAKQYKERADYAEKLLKNQKIVVEIQARQQEGRLFDLDDFKGYRLIVVDIWASWCGPCVQAMPAAKKMQSELATKGVAYTFLSIDEGKARMVWERMNSGLQLEQSYLLDSAASKQFQVQLAVETIPRYVIINNKGELLEKEAPGPDEPEKLRALIDKLGR